MNETAELLPIAKVPGYGELLIDVKNREFRGFFNPDIVIKMHSEKGKQMVEEMKGKDWNSDGLSTGAVNCLEVSIV